MIPGGGEVKNERNVTTCIRDHAMDRRHAISTMISPEYTVEMWLGYFELGVSLNVTAASRLQSCILLSHPTSSCISAEAEA